MTEEDQHETAKEEINLGIRGKLMAQNVTIQTDKRRSKQIRTYLNSMR